MSQEEAYVKSLEIQADPPTSSQDARAFYTENKTHLPTLTTRLSAPTSKLRIPYDLPAPLAHIMQT
jgi:hypothetical protein